MIGIPAANRSRILIVEDDDTLRETLRYNLERAGFQVEGAADGIQGLQMARSQQPDLIILDIMLPGLDGFSICRIVSHEFICPILMLTALQDEEHLVAGLELGANDYMVKPFSLSELLARVRALLRWNERRAQHRLPNIVVAGPIKLDRDSRRVWYGERELALSHREFDLLAYLMTNAGVALSRDVLLEHVWGNQFDGSQRTIDVHVRWLREKIEPDPSNPLMIHTVRGIGYLFQSPASAGIRPSLS